MPNILVIDDDSLVLRAIEKVLKIGGYDVDVSDNGEDAIELSRKKKYDVVLSDIRMPRMDGIETCNKIEGNPKKLFMTGYAKREEEIGFKFLRKPFGVHDLLNFIKG